MYMCLLSLFCAVPPNHWGLCVSKVTLFNSSGQVYKYILVYLEVFLVDESCNIVEGFSVAQCLDEGCH